MTWFSSTNASVDANGTVVTINDGADTSAVSAGDALILGSNSPVEIKSRAAGQIELVEAWSGSAQNNVNAHVIPTSGDFTSATAALREATQTTQDNFAANEAWGTQLGTVDYTGYDGVTYTARTFRQADADIQAIQDGNQEIIDTAVEDKIGEIRYSKLDNPLCHILKKNKLVDTLVGDLTWNRASTATYVDRYGVVRTAAVDEPRQEVDGWLVEGASTNQILDSENIFSANWPLNTEVSSGGTDSGLGVVLTKVVPTTNNAQHVIRQLVSTTTGTAKVSGSFFAKKGGGYSWVQILLRGSDSGNRVEINVNLDTCTTSRLTAIGTATILSAECVDFGQYVRVVVVADINDPSSTNHQIIVYALEADDNNKTFAGDGVSGFWCGGVQLEQQSIPSSYIPTTDAAATRTADVTNAPADDNMPDTNKPWSILIRANMTLVQQYGSLIRINGPSGVAIAITNNGGLAYVSLTTTDGEKLYTGFDYPREDRIIQFTAVYDGENVSFYADGEFKHSITLDGKIIISAVGGEIVLGDESFSPVNDARIYDFALNEAEIKFLAGE